MKRWVTSLLRSVNGTIKPRGGGENVHFISGMDRKKGLQKMPSFGKNSSKYSVKVR